jgi:hydrogenase maturation protein HypF
MTATAVSHIRVRHRIRVGGVVQGVGFRPFVHRLAGELGLTGVVGNDTQGVFVEIEGRADDVARFEHRLGRDAPPLAHITDMASTAMATLGDAAFLIVGSRNEGAPRTFVSPDVAVCDDCLAELADPGDRRHQLRASFHDHRSASV